jgi:hypothetical protein
MISRFIVGFVLFAGFVYYFNIDVRATVDKTGLPVWLSQHGFPTNSQQLATSSTSTIAITNIAATTASSE